MPEQTVSQPTASGFRNWFFDQLAMYLAYHRNRRNQATHHIGVPLIVFSLLVALSQIPLAQVNGVPITMATALLGVLLLVYLAAVPLIGLCAVIFYGVMYGLVVEIAATSTLTIWSVAVGGFVLGWIIQLIGHHFEGRRPALTVNFLQVFMAPPFLIAEVLFALGMEPALEATLRRRAEKY